MGSVYAKDQSYFVAKDRKPSCIVTFSSRRFGTQHAAKCLELYQLAVAQDMSKEACVKWRDSAAAQM